MTDPKRTNIGFGFSAPRGMMCPLGCGGSFHVFSLHRDDAPPIRCVGLDRYQAAIYLQTERLIAALGARKRKAK